MATLLLVDDEESFHEIAAPHLAQYRVIPAYTGQQARDALSRERVDVALVDLNLTHDTGLALLGEFRRDHPHVILLVVTAHCSVQHADWARKAGAVDVVDKSEGNFSRLGALIDAALRSAPPAPVELLPEDRWLQRVVTLIVGILELARRGQGAPRGELQRLITLLHAAMQERDADRRFAASDCEAT